MATGYQGAQGMIPVTYDYEGQSRVKDKIVSSFGGHGYLIQALINLRVAKVYHKLHLWR